GENELLGIGGDNAEELYVACGYFATLDTEANLAFKERYRAHFGERAPTLNPFGQSTSEGMHFLAALLDREQGQRAYHERLGSAPLRYRSVR
ncbi:ABC transporter substrate-binding protein, partial [Bacillus amyloliquefaciens]|uniref:ABC transporter substrate-binding protein n=1 Tax=Bacillus amyloliquefaciens TaxID=1390 RepID=UPI00140436DD|nr:transporter substrate-binding protein [Bacillus amyloliquefaciens]